jgi:membrane fusion protein (multidrug efflux system)
MFHRPYIRSMTVLAISIGLLSLSACSSDDAGGGNQAQARPGGKGRPEGGRPELPPVPVATQASFTGDIASHYRATATLEAVKEASVLARVSGIVEEITAEEGDHVKEGQVLLRIEDSEYALRLNQAKAKADNAKSKFDRAKELIDKDLMSTELYEAARNDHQSAQAELGLAELNASHTRVPAPFSGQVVRRSVDSGENVSPGTPLFDLADFTPLLAKVYVPAKEFKKLKVEQPVQLTLDSNGEILSGRIKLVSPVIDPASGTIKVTVEIPSYPAGTRPGDFVEVNIVTEHHSNSVLVPKGAVVEDQGETVVFVATADSTAERRPVDVGFTLGPNTEILEGLEAGEPIVVRGQRSLKDGGRLKILSDGV